MRADCTLSGETALSVVGKRVHVRPKTSSVVPLRTAKAFGTNQRSRARATDTVVAGTVEARIVGANDGVLMRARRGERHSAAEPTVGECSLRRPEVSCCCYTSQAMHQLSPASTTLGTRYAVVKVKIIP